MRRLWRSGYFLRKSNLETRKSGRGLIFCITELAIRFHAEGPGYGIEGLTGEEIDRVKARLAKLRIIVSVL